MVVPMELWRPDLQQGVRLVRERAEYPSLSVGGSGGMMTMRARRLGNGSYALVLAAVLALLVGCQGRAGDDAGTGSGSLSTGRSSPARSASGKPPSVTPSTDGGSSLSPTGGSAGDYPLGVFSCRLWYRGDTSNPLERTSRVLSAAGQRARFVHRDLTVQLSLGGPEG